MAESMLKYKFQASKCFFNFFFAMSFHRVSAI